MRYLTYLDENGKHQPACLMDGRAVEFPPLLQAIGEITTFQAHSVKGLLSLTPAQKALLNQTCLNHLNMGEGLDLDKLTLAPPIPNPGKIICIGMNYPSRADTPRPEYPVVFLKPTSGLSSHRAPIRLARACENVHFEAELAFYIADTCHNVPLSEARSHIAGYTIANDVGDQTIEKRTSQWTSGKMFDTFTPTGPVFVPADEITDPQDLMIRTWRNGDLVQESSTVRMLFTVDEILAYLSTLTTLQPGDLVLTGSPKLFHGELVFHPPLEPGEEIKITISSLGTLINHIEQGA
ncbi:fumarylacetoacetate hydrolase family protein [Chloroflexota bacterium]|nr:fumarylacetoacetate hydrolase family protein [Chloroflexota bacterium]